MRIDAHQHFWRLSRGDYGWLTPELGTIHRDFLPGDLAPLLAAARIDATILVQAAPTTAETDFLLDLAGRTPFVAGVAGWVDFEAADAADRIASLAENAKLVGLRPMIQDLPDDEWMLRPALAPAIQAMTDAGLAFDALVKPRHLPILARFAERWPDLAIVIDHGGKPDIAAGVLEPWATDIRAIARDTRVFCKLSGLLTEAAVGAGAADLGPWIDVLLGAFGPERLLWGSDWPVLTLADGYPAWLETTGQALAHLPAAHERAIMGDTAAAFYRLNRLSA